MAEFISSHCLKDNDKYFQKKIVIIGAGIAGLACGSRLKELGFSEVLILEARNRVGGRIHTIDYGDNFIEMGAQWIHGQRDNIIYDIASSNGLVDGCISYIDEVLSFNNLCLEEKEALCMMIAFLDQKIANISAHSYSCSSFLSYLNDSFKEFLNQSKFDKLIDCLNVGYEWFCKFQCELNGCVSLSDLSAHLFNNYRECVGNQSGELKYGYSSVLNVILKTIPPDWILKNKFVNRIDWSNFKKEVNLENKMNESSATNSIRNVKVICKDGDQFLADHVIVTIPLGCLKQHYQSLFVPALCKSKQTAIHCLGFGVINKVYLDFENPFWNVSDVFNVLWEKSFDEKILKKDSYKNKTPSQLWIRFIVRFAYTQSHPNMLCAWVTSEGALVMESLTEKEVIGDCMTLLEILLDKQLPLPCRMLKSSWMSDSFACGSYSFLSTECEKENVSNQDLAEPEYSDIFCSKHPILLFAGEASHEYYFSTVHGAYETGIREAERIFHHYSNLAFVKLTNALESMPFDTLQVWPNEDNLLSNLNVVIVGAGIAGLVCCMHLANSNFCKINILEAQDKVGGRVASVNFSGKILELGAQWIHGTENELFEFSKKNNLLPYSLDEISFEGKGIFCTSNGCVIETNIVEEVKKVLNDAKTELEKGNYNTKINKSVMTFLSAAFESYILNCCDENEVCLKRSVFDWYIKMEVIDNACDNLNHIAVQSFTEWDECPEELYHIEYQKGFGSLLDVLISKIPNNSLYLNKPVSTIKWCDNFKIENGNKLFLKDRPSESYPVLLECKDGEKIYADTVIVTASAGFLKENMHSFFIPPLPDKKLNAFKKIGFGTINKIFLVYDKPFWSIMDLGFQLVWTKGNEESKNILMENPWIRGITGFDIVQKVPNVLLGWIGGEEAKLMEKINEEKISAVCTNLLRNFLNRPDIPCPSNILRSCWYSNPYIRGAYSNRTLDYYQDDSTLHHLQYPLCTQYVTKGKKIQWPTLMFAGEAIDAASFSSAHGAFHSGLKAANCLIKACLQLKDAEAMSSSS